MYTLFLIVFVDLVGFGLIIPLLPFYAEHFQASPAMVGLLMATYSLAQFIAAPLWGRFSDRLGRRPILLVSLAGATLAYTLLASAGTLAVLFLARALGGFMAGNIAAAFAYVADVTTPADRAKGMGLIGAAFGLGFIFGPAIGGMLAGADPLTADYTSPSLAAAALSATAFVMTVFLLPESLPPHARRRKRHDGDRAPGFLTLLARRPILHLLAIAFLATFVFAGMETTFAMWSRRHIGWGPEQNGYLFAFVGAISALIQGGLVGRLARRVGEARLIVTGAALLAVGMLLIPLTQSVTMLVLTMTLVATGFAFLTPSLNSLLSLQASPGMQGQAMGIGRSATTLARVVGPIGAGGLFFAFGKDWPFFAGAALMSGVVVLAWTTILRSAPPRHADGAPSLNTDTPPPPGNPLP
jgi:DHA1 family tetracycline resistance protein-like MFS transporter